jgi:hypothetical protein
VNNQNIFVTVTCQNVCHLFGTILSITGSGYLIQFASKIIAVTVHFIFQQFLDKTAPVSPYKSSSVNNRDDCSHLEQPSIQTNEQVIVNYYLVLKTEQ